MCVSDQFCFCEFWINYGSPTHSQAPMHIDQSSCTSELTTNNSSALSVALGSHLYEIMGPLYILSWHCLFTGRPFHIGSTSITNPKEVSWLTTSQTLSINMLPSEHGCLHIVVYTWSRHRQSLFSHELRQSLTVPYAYILSIHKTGAYSTQSSLSGIVYVFNCFSLYFYQAFCSLIGPLHLWIGSRAHFTPLFKLMFYLQNNQFPLLIAVFSLSL